MPIHSSREFTLPDSSLVNLSYPNFKFCRTPKTTNRQRSFSGADRVTRPRPVRNPSGASNIDRSDSMTLNRAAGGRENYRNNWDNFDQVTATMRRDKNKPIDR